MSSTILVDKVDPQSGTALEIGSSGDTITIPSGATITNNGTATGFGNNAPSFRAYMSATQSIATATLTVLAFNNDSGTTGSVTAYDTDSAFDTSNYRFTPQTAGYYYAWLYCGLQDLTDAKVYQLNLAKNGATDGDKFSQISFPMGATKNVYGHTAGVVYLNGSSDYIQALMRHTNGSDRTTADTYNTGFGAWKLNGVS
jgi:hypothetical protein